MGILIIIISFNAQVSGQSSQHSTYPEFLEANLPYTSKTFHFNQTFSEMTIVKTFTISQFRDVTFADILIEQSGSNVNSVSFSVKLNGINATNSYSESNLFDRESILFILDAHAMILPKNPNILTFTVNVTFKEPNPWGFTKTQAYSFKFDEISIKTSYQQSISQITNQLNQSNSHFTALIVDPVYNLATQGSMLGNNSNFFSPFTYGMNFYVILPKELKNDYYLNISFSYASNIDIKAIFLKNFGLVTSNQNSNGISYLFRYIGGNNPGSLSEGTFSFSPRSPGIININLQGYFFINDNYKIFPGGPEMDLFLFVNATIIIPLALLSKLIYRRLR